MSYSDDSNGTDPEQTPNPRLDPGESAGTPGWLIALNSFLERAFLKADVDTGALPRRTEVDQAAPARGTRGESDASIRRVNASWICARRPPSITTNTT